MLARSNLASTNFPTRPAFATKGTPVILFANYLPMSVAPDMIVFRYKLSLAAAKSSKSSSLPTGPKIRRLIALLLQQHFSSPSPGVASDFKDHLLSNKKLFDTPSKSYSVSYYDETDQMYDGAPVHELTLTFEVTIPLSALVDHISSSNMAAFHAHGDHIQALNIILSHHPKLVPTATSFAANKHFRIDNQAQNTTNLDQLLVAIRGFCVSVRAATARILLNVQVKNAVMYRTPRTLAEYIVMFSSSERDMRALEQAVEKMTIRVTHMDKDRNGRRVRPPKTIFKLARPGDGAAPNPPRIHSYGATADQVQYHTETGWISVAANLRDKWKKTIDPKYKDLPVVNVGNRLKPSYLHPQFCDIVPNQQCKKTLSPTNTTNMLRFAVVRPEVNAGRIVEEGAGVLGITPSLNSTLQNFKLSASSELITVAARVLPPVGNISYRNNASVMVNAGSWNYEGKLLYKSAPKAIWTYINIQSSSKEGAGAFEGKMFEIEKALADCGITDLKFAEGNPDIVVRSSASTREQKIRDFTTILEQKLIEVKSLLQKNKKDPSDRTFVLVVLPAADENTFYNVVKRVGDVRVGVLTICMRGQRWNKWNIQYMANIALKVNLKLGGVNQTIAPAKLGIVGLGKTMVVGLDVTHPSPTSSSAAPSVAVMVASVDSVLAQFPCHIKVQRGRQEKVEANEMSEMLTSRLKLWQARNRGALPENIVVYRDGVSEGQYQSIFDIEVPGLRKACQETYSPKQTQAGVPRISVIVAGKRHNTRFYPTPQDPRQSSRSGNPQPGTVVDRGVTEAANWDFFMQSHNALQGTARPCHYFVVLDEVFRSQFGVMKGQKLTGQLTSAAEALEELTFSMCHLFSRATKIVSLCPPVYYADRACERGRCYLAELDNNFQAAGGSAPGPGGLGPTPTTAMVDAVTVHPDLVDTMFYI